jgi:hypothetical protein
MKKLIAKVPLIGSLILSKIETAKKVVHINARVVSDRRKNYLVHGAE